MGASREGPRRRFFTAEFKRSILDAVDSAKGRGEATAILRREGLHWSHVASWRRHAQDGGLADSWMSLEIREHIDVLTRERMVILAELRELAAANAALRDKRSRASTTREPRVHAELDATPDEERLDARGNRQLA
jgi:transposase-like protein